MGFIDSEFKLSYVWKKLLQKLHTTTNKEWYEEYDANDRVTLDHHQIRIDDIPETPPSYDSDLIEIIDSDLTEDPTVEDHKAWWYCSTVDDLSTKEGDFIPPSYGQSYTIRVYDNNGTEIPSSDDSNWMFEYDNGLLVFENNPEDYGWALPIHIKGYRYIGRKLSYISYGLECLTDKGVGGTASASGYSSGGTAPALAFDKNKNTMWESYSDPASSTVYLQYAWTDNVAIIRYGIYILDTSSETPVSWEVQIQLPDSSWITVDTKSGETLNSDEIAYYDIDTPVYGKAFRIIISEVNSGTRAKINELILLSRCPEGSMNFISLGDTPDAYIGHKNRVVKVNNEGIGLEFSDILFSYQDLALIISASESPIYYSTYSPDLEIYNSGNSANMLLATRASGASHRRIYFMREGLIKGVLASNYNPPDIFGMYLSEDYTNDLIIQKSGTTTTIGGPTIFLRGSSIAIRDSGGDAVFGWNYEYMKLAFEGRFMSAYGYGLTNLFLWRNPNRDNTIYNYNPSFVVLGIGSSSDAKPNIINLFSQDLSNSESLCLRIDCSDRAIRLPVLTTTARDAIPTPEEGSVIYNSDTKTLEFYDGSSWKQVSIV